MATSCLSRKILGHRRAGVFRSSKPPFKAYTPPGIKDNNKAMTLCPLILEVDM